MDAIESPTPRTFEELCAATGDDFDEYALQGAAGDRAFDSQGRRRSSYNRETPIDPLILHDPLLNPAIALEDRDDSYTPSTLEEMVGQANSPRKRERLRFFDLPSEIRVAVYSLALMPEGGFPMDFASCVDYAHEHADYKNHIHADLDERTSGRVWFCCQWRSMRRQLLNSTVSRQYYEEASNVFYGQPFRFTGDLGWIVLYHFLENLSFEQRNRLIDITVCHPGFAALPEVNPPHQQQPLGFVNITGDYYDLFDEHMSDFGLGPTLRLHDTLINLDCTWTTLEEYDGTVRLLATCSSLTKLTLTLPQFQDLGEQFSFHDCLNHPIHTYSWPQGEKLTCSVVHLVSSDHDCSDSMRPQPCLAEIYGLPDERDFSGPNTAPFGNEVILSGRANQAQHLFEAVKERGWCVKEMFYDKHGHYPVKHGEGCVNKNMCQFMCWSDDSGNDPYHCCPGNAVEAVAHTGLPFLIYTRDSRLLGKGYWKLS